jgi:hypothetical protein
MNRNHARAPFAWKAGAAALAAIAAAALGFAAPASAAAISTAAWSASQPQPGSNGVRYTWTFTTPTSDTLAEVRFTVPPGTTSAGLTVADLAGLGAGAVTHDTVTNTVVYTLGVAANVPAGTTVMLAVDGFVNTAVQGTYHSTITTVNAGNTAVDTGDSNNVVIDNASTLVKVVVARSTAFTSDTDGITLAMDPSVAALADQSRAVTLNIATNAANGYTLDTRIDRQLTGTVNPSATFAAASAGVGSPAGSVTANRFGYRVTTAGGTATPAAAGYLGYTTGGETVLSNTTSTAGDQVVLTNRAVIDHLQPADTYTGTITYTVTPRY